MIIKHFYIEDKKIINISSFLAYKEDDEYKYQYIKGENECNVCFEFFLNFSNVNNVFLFPVHNVLINFISIMKNQIVHCVDYVNYIFYLFVV